MEDRQFSPNIDKNIALNGFNYFPRPGYWRRRQLWHRCKRWLVIPTVFALSLATAGCQDQDIEKAVVKIVVDSAVDLAFQNSQQMVHSLCWLGGVAAETFERLIWR